MRVLTSRLPKRSVLLLVVPLAFAPATLARTQSSASAAACARPTIAFMGPITGHAAFIGKEQLGFARYAIRSLGRGRFRLVEADTQLDPQRAANVGSRLHADASILAVVGPAASREVLAVAPIFERRSRLAFVSGSALSAALTNGSIPNFFRVVPNESVQAPTIATYIGQTLKAETVVVVHDRSAYSRRLATDVAGRLRAGGAGVRRASVDTGTSDFSSLVAGVSPATDVVFVPWSSAASAEIFGRQLRRQGHRAIIFGSDGLDSGDFTIPGSYVTSFAPDVRGIVGNAAFVRGYRARFVSNFGPPVYVATQAVLRSVERACADGEATRAEVERQLRRTLLTKTVLGGRLRFSLRGDVMGSRFSIFKLGAGGRKTLVPLGRR